MKCDWCGVENDDKFDVVISGTHFKVCAGCLNLYANEEFDELTDRVEKRGGAAVK